MFRSILVLTALLFSSTCEAQKALISFTAPRHEKLAVYFGIISCVFISLSHTPKTFLFCFFFSKNKILVGSTEEGPSDYGKTKV